MFDQECEISSYFLIYVQGSLMNTFLERFFCLACYNISIIMADNKRIISQLKFYIHGIGYPVQNQDLGQQSQAEGLLRQ